MATLQLRIREELLHRRATPVALPGIAPGRGSSLQNLRQLVVMRNVAAVAQAVTILAVDRALGISLPLLPMGTVVVFLLLFNFLTRQRLGQPEPVTEREMMLQLLVDVGALTVQLSLSGGATNPFVGMYLLPLTMAAAWLTATHIWAVAVATLVCYTAIVFVFRPLLPEGEEARLLPLLTTGMWVNYAITAGIIAHFVMRMASSLRQDERLLGNVRERDLCNEHLVRIGTLAAGAAHELNSPLSAMALMLEELEQRRPDDLELRRSLVSLGDQLRSCHGTLTSLLAVGDTAFATDGSVMPLDRFVGNVVDAFRTRRSDANVVVTVDTAGAPPNLPRDLALAQALSNLLCNAADVSPQLIEVRLSWNDDTLRILVRDRGPGISPEVEEQIGTLFFTTKPRGKGNGLGLCLANIAVVRLGGTLSVGNAEGGGAVAEIVLPATSMKPLELDLMVPR